MEDSPVGPWQPRYTLTPAISHHLVEIEMVRAVVVQIPLLPAVQSEIRNRARLRSTHSSTRIEGNRLTLAEVEQVLARRKAPLQGSEKDVEEVRGYWKALLRIEEWAAGGAELTEELIQRLHALVEGRNRPSGYRDGQSTIRDSEAGALVYLPPEARDVPALMAGLVAWIRQAGEERLPPPLIAGLAHYQFVTIHPYYDGNGRTARLLTAFLLQRDGYGLNGFLSLEEGHARDIATYYRSLAVHPHHNYYEGRETADLTSWLDYFLTALTAAFTSAKEEAGGINFEERPNHLPENVRDELVSAVGRYFAATLAARGVKEQEIPKDFGDFRRRFGNAGKGHE